jgi:hypothetical protein
VGSYFFEKGGVVLKTILRLTFLGVKFSVANVTQKNGLKPQTNALPNFRNLTCATKP